MLDPLFMLQIGMSQYEIIKASRLSYDKSQFWFNVFVWNRQVLFLLLIKANTILINTSNGPIYIFIMITFAIQDLFECFIKVNKISNLRA